MTTPLNLALIYFFNFEGYKETKQAHKKATEKAYTEYKKIIQLPDIKGPFKQQMQHYHA